MKTTKINLTKFTPTPVETPAQMLRFRNMLMATGQFHGHTGPRKGREGIIKAMARATGYSTTYISLSLKIATLQQTVSQLRSSLTAVILLNSARAALSSCKKSCKGKAKKSYRK